MKGANMTTDWDDLIEQVARDLRDPGHVVWSAEELAGYVERALSAYTRHAPRYQSTVLASVAGAYSYDLDGIDGLLEVTAVWYPWDPSRPQVDPPPVCPHAMLEDGAVTIFPEAPPRGTAQDQLRVLYTAEHTVAGRNEATETTLDAWGRALVALGACAWAALARQVGEIGAVTPTGRTPAELAAYGEICRRGFAYGLEQARRLTMHRQDVRVTREATV